ncbi:MAG: CvpA family protein [Clostridiales bacterium]|nr:CvpA family protein [Clostridiales bacterium]MDD7432377.1 CvpA family protein [Clostridiales bacterium]MDY3061293.1 CvpA family protein [Eubacteriales bacterium]
MILDIILLCILLFELFRGLRRGLITSLGMIIVLLISFSLASVYSEPLAQAVLNSRTEFRVQEQIEKRLEEEIQKWTSPVLPQPADPDGAARTEQGSGQNAEQNGGITPLPNLNFRPQDGQNPGDFTYEIQQSLKNMGLPPAFLGVFEGKYGSIPAQLQGLLDKSRETGASAIHDAIHSFSRQIFELIAHALAFLLIFFVSHFVLKLLLKALSGLINKIPLIGGLNHLLGMFMGLIVGLVLCGLLLSVLPPLSGSLPDLREQLASSRLATWFMQSQVYEKLLALIY